MGKGHIKMSQKKNIEISSTHFSFVLSPSAKWWEFLNERQRKILRSTLLAELNSMMAVSLLAVPKLVMPCARFA